MIKTEIYKGYKVTINKDYSEAGNLCLYCIIIRLSDNKKCLDEIDLPGISVKRKIELLKQRVDSELETGERWDSKT